MKSVRPKKTPTVINLTDMSITNASHTQTVQTTYNACRTISFSKNAVMIPSVNASRSVKVDSST